MRSWQRTAPPRRVSATASAGRRFLAGVTRNGVRLEVHESHGAATMINISPTVRIVLGMLLTLAGLLFLGSMTGLIPSEDRVIEEERVTLTRLLALQYSTATTQGDISGIEDSMRQLVVQSPEILSISLHRNDGKLVANAGSPVTQREIRSGSHSGMEANLHQATVYRDDSQWGTVVVRFNRLSNTGVPGFHDNPLSAVLTLFIAFPLGGFLLVSGIRYRRFASPACVPYQVRTVLDALAEGVLLLDAKGRIMLANNAFANSVDKMPGALLGRKVSDLRWEFGRIHEDEFPWDTVLRLGEIQTGKQLRLICPSGATRTFTVNAAPVKDGGQYRGVMATFDDVTQLEEKNEQLEDMLGMLKKSRDEIRRQNRELQILATRDPLTDCLNRRSFFEKSEPVFETALRNGQQLACIMVDIDLFKSINDRYGHVKGDEVIRMVAQTLQASLRSSDTICRYGGEEFCISLPGLNIDQAIATAMRARTNIAAMNFPEISGDSSLRVTASFGITAIDREVADFAHFIDRADQALYISKNTGRNRVSVWDSETGVRNPVTSATFEAGADPGGDRMDAPTPDGDPSVSDTDQHAVAGAPQADHDSLPLLPNRKLIHNRIVEAIEFCRNNQQYCSLLMLDLNMFRRINNTMGDFVGDELLSEVSQRLVQSLRSTDVVVRFGNEDSENLIYRLSGDEFGILLNGMECTEFTTQVVNRIMESLSHAFDIEGHEIKLACNIGISFYPENGSDADSLLKNAAVALYYAKCQGPNRYQFYNEGRMDSSTGNFQLQNELQQAIEQDQLELYYQPKIDIKSGRIVCMEALLRWRHPEMGMIPPSQFLKLAENTGLIIPIGKWVLRTACRQLGDWQRGGYPDLSVAVNLSALQFSQKDLLMQIGTILDETGIAPWHLDLELTEVTVMDDIAAAATTLRLLHKAGMRISIDDFGTGFSSLNNLKRFPIRSVKIDRSVIRDITTDTDDAGIIKAIITMAHGMGLRVVAEGVETEAQFAFLDNLHCDEFQGFLFSPPVPQNEAGSLLLENDARGRLAS
ncbi:MAG: diguanylate cyclase [Gammaproteobacteria bacterium]